MRKENLQEFIQKYYLGGTLTKESGQDWLPVPITVENNIAKVSIRSGDKSVLAVVDYNLELPDGELVIGNTKQFLSILGAFGQDIEVQLRKVGQNYVNVLTIIDPQINATVALADPSQVDERFELKATPTVDAEFTLKKEFVSSFVKARKALSDATMFAVLPNVYDKTVEFIVNYNPKSNVNNIRVQTDNCTVNTDFDPLYFSCSNVVAILAENPQYLEAKMTFSTQGLMTIEFKGEDYEAKYYLKSYEIN
jgi:hypothetical protein